jgi:hypothetical protein
VKRSLTPSRLRWFETEITASDGSVITWARKQLPIRQKRMQPSRD